MALQFYFNLFGQAGIVFSKDNQNFFTAKVINNRLVVGQGVTQFGTGEDNTVVFAMGAGSHGSHTVAFVAVEGPVDFQRCAQQAFAWVFRSGDGIKNFLGFEQGVEVTNAGMVTTDDHLVNAVVLAEGGMKQGFTGTGISHVKGVTGINNVFRYKVTLDQGVDTFDTYFCGDVARFQVTDQGVDQNAVTYVKGDLAQMFVGSVHGVSQLHGSNVCPAFFIHDSAGFCRAQINAFEFFGELAFGEYFYRTSQAEFFSGHNHLNAGMIFQCDFPEYFVSGLFAMTFVNFFTFPFFLGFGHFEFFFDLHGGIDLTISFQGDLIANFDCCGISSRSVEHNRNWPESTISQQEVFANAFPVSFGHKAVQRRETADTEHDQVAFNLGRDFDFFQTCGFFQFSVQSSAFKLTTYKTFPAMGCN